MNIPSHHHHHQQQQQQQQQHEIAVADSSFLDQESTDFERVESDGFVKIGGPLTDASDPRTFKRNSSNPAMSGSSPNSKSDGNNRLFYLRVIDSRKWHYTETFALFLDFFVQVLAISFSTNPMDFYNEIGAVCSRYFSSILMICYFVDMLIRILGLRSALFRSHSNIADLACLIAMLILLIGRYLAGPKQFAIQHFGRAMAVEYNLCLAYLMMVSMRLILKPRARTFSKKLHKFSSRGDTIRISIESLRASLTRIPGISAMSIEMMETDLVIICGRDEGDMTRDELMRFLEKALFYRPSHLSATEFLSHLRDIDAQSSKLAYSSVDVVRSTLWHWSNQSGDLISCFFIVCVNASISPALAYFLSKLSIAFEEHDEDTLRFGILGVLGICVPFVLGNYAIGYFQSKMISKATEKMQSSLLDIILRQGTYFFAERSEGDLNNLFSSDIARVNALWQAVFWNLLNPFVAVVFGFGYALYMDYSIGIMAFSFSAMLLSSGPQGFAAQRSKEFGSKNAYVAAEFQNAVACQKVVRAYAIQDPLLRRFRRTVGTLRKNQFLKDFWSSIVQIYIESAMYIFVAIMTASLAMKVYSGGISSGDFLGFTILLSRVSAPVTVLGGFMRVAIGNASSLQRIDDIIVGLGGVGGSGINAKNDEDADLPALPKMQKELSIEKLVFKYDKTSEKYILNELSALIPRGAYTCVVGPSGCGKSTLLACLMQFQEADGGCIRLDGHDIFNFSKSSFMDQTAVVFQDGGILNGTIYDNIRYGNIGATNEDCIEAANLAECHFIRDLKDGFDTVVGQHATCSLSGGQAQRICLARALCRKPSILLLDEATSALDPETEASIIATLEKLSGKMHMTIISVTHRLATSINADLILVLNQGRVAESGRYDALVNKGGLFYEMVHKTENGDDEDQANRRTRGGGGTRRGQSAATITSNAPFVMGAGVVGAGIGVHNGRQVSVPFSSSTVGSELDEPSTMDSQLALQQFTKKLSSRVINEQDLATARGGSAWNRYASRNSWKGRHPSQTDEQQGGRRSRVSDRNSWRLSDGRGTGGGPGRTSNGEDERNKYFVL